MLDSDTWFTEVDKTAATAFSLQLKEKLHEEKTPYQTIAIYDTQHFGKLMVIDGCTMLSTRDNFLYHEMLSHPVLFTHPAPRKVCIIGGGDCGTLREVLRHEEIESVTQVDIDERVTRLAEQYFPELTASNQDPRATLLFDDGLRWVQEAAPGSLDVIIVDSTDPVGPAEGLFGESFYRDCLRALGEDGLLIQQSESPIYHLHLLGEMREAMQAAGFQALQTLFFPQPIYPSGWWSATIASKAASLGEPRWDAIEARGFDTYYYNAEIHRAALAQPEFFRKRMG